MSRGQLRSASNVCADCSAQDPGWASVNRGVLVCEECCSIHRSLGRHVSQIKSLRKGTWNPSQLQMVHQLVSSGANNIWEHSLLDPSQNKQGRRKPNPRDPVHPTKADFIRAKYQFLAFTSKQKDAEINTAEDLSKQLHSSVRTANLETSLRLLSLGADPNYYHPNKGNCPLHVASQAGQATQVEILVVYGADPGAYDANGKTPVEHAKADGHQDLADRLVECQYELTDRLASFLCGRKPDHRVGQHFIIPEMADSSLDLSELAKAAKKKLQALPNHLFEELAMDVFDEVDRRENNSVWLASQTDTTLVSDRQTVPFLPVNPEFSSTRNQGRQKLARFNAREFATLIIDILSDARRRQHGLATPSSTGSTPTDRIDRPLVKTNSLSDDEPLYDSVASDEDYASIGDNQSLKEEKNSLKEKSMESLASSEQSDGPITLEEYLEVKRALVESQARVQQLVQTNKDLKQEITLLHNMVQKLIGENNSLRRGEGPVDGASVPNGHGEPANGQVRSGRPQSMFEPRDPQRHQHWSKPISGTRINTRSQGTLGSQPVKFKLDQDRLNPNRLAATMEGQRIAETDYDNPTLMDTASNSTRSSECSQITATDSGHSQSTEGTIGGMGACTDSGEDLALPTQDDVVKKTERITKKIQELLVSAQEGKLDSYPGCAEKIKGAVTDMASLFPQNVKDECVVTALKSLTDHTSKLQEQCSSSPPEGQGDPRLQTQLVIQCAYEIAKAAKQLVMLFE